MTDDQSRTDARAGLRGPPEVSFYRQLVILTAAAAAAGRDPRRRRKEKYTGCTRGCPRRGTPETKPNQTGKH